MKGSLIRKQLSEAIIYVHLFVGFNCSLYREYGDNLMLSALILHSLRRRLGKMVGGLGAEDMIVELLLLEEKN